MKKWKLGLLAWVLAFALPVGHAGAAVIDRFNQGSALLSPTNYSPGVVVLQTGLDTNSTIGGTRKLVAQTQNKATLQVNAAAGELSFDAVNDFGYFTVAYGTENPLGVDLKADGSEAFLLSFSNVSMPGLWRGIYAFSVNGVAYNLLPQLAAMHGAGTLRIPVSYFSKSAQFVVNEISLEGARVESQYRLTLDSIVTVPPSLSVVTLSAGAIQLRWNTNGANFVVESATTMDAPWQTLSNALSVVGSQFSVTIGASESSGYFRLRKQ